MMGLSVKQRSYLIIVCRWVIEKGEQKVDFTILEGEIPPAPMVTSEFEKYKNDRHIVPSHFSPYADNLVAPMNDLPPVPYRLHNSSPRGRGRRRVHAHT